jgi:hypothetical protein
MYGVPAANTSLAGGNIPLKGKDYFAVLAFQRRKNPFPAAKPESYFRRAIWPQRRAPAPTEARTVGRRQRNRAGVP